MADQDSTPRSDPRPRGKRASRRHLLTGGAATAAWLTTFARRAVAEDRSCCPIRIAAAPSVRAPSLSDLAEGNAMAAAIARRSRFVMETVEAVQAIAAALPDPLR